jgi:integrase
MGLLQPNQVRYEMRNASSPLLGETGAIKGYLRHRSELSEQTKAWYEGLLQRYAKWLTGRGLEAIVAGVSMDNAEAYIEERRETVKVSSTRCDAIVLKSFGQYIGKRILRADSPLTDLRIAQPDDTTRRALTDQELTRLIGVSKRGLEGRRNYAIVMTAAGCGLRLGELTALWTTDVLFEYDELVVQGRTSKSRKTRKVVMPPETVAALDDYLSDRAGESPVFLTRLNKAFHKQGMAAVFRSLAAEAEIPDLSAHSLRHTWATNYLRAGSGDIVQLTRAAGWRDKQNRMAMRYVHERPLSERRRQPSVFTVLEGGQRRVG